LITICVVTHRRSQQLAQLLCELEACSLPEAYAGLIVVDNGGSPDSEEIVYGANPRLRARLLRCDSKIKSVALNKAISEIHGGLVTFIDDDAAPESQWLQAYAKAFESKAEGYYFGGATKVTYEAPPPQWLRAFLPRSAIGYSGPTQGVPEFETNFMGFNWAARVQDLKQVGGFSALFGPGTPSMVGDESFTQHKLQRIGIRAHYLPDAVVTHSVPAKNCTEEWLLPRTEPAGFQQGLLREQFMREKGLPVATWRFVIKRIMRRSSLRNLGQLLCLKRPGRFWARYWWRWTRGVLHGAKVGAAQRPLEEEFRRTFMPAGEVDTGHLNQTPGQKTCADANHAYNLLSGPLSN
jgi:GT2 family glycosyltransferase